MSFWSALGDELGERRRRMRRALKPWRAGLLEFLFIAGFTLGLVGPLIYGARALPWWLGLLPPLVFFAGYVALDAQRQKALAAGGEEEAVRQRFKAPTIAVAILAPLLGLALYLTPALRPAAPVAAVEEPASTFLPEDPGDVPVTGIVR